MVNEKSKLTETQINEIFSHYENNVSMLKISKLYNTSATLIQNLICSRGFELKISENYPQKDNMKMVVVCKKTGKEFSDYWNKSGCITNHIKKIYHIKLESPYLLKQREYKTGKFWYDEYFTFEYREMKSEFHCKLCDWTTEDVNNESGAYEKHLKNIHNIELNEYLKQFPNDRSFFKKEIYDELIKCEICGKYFKSISTTHLNTHNITPHEYKQKYGTKLVCSETSNKLKKIYPSLFTGSTAHKFHKTSKLEEFIIENINTELQQSNRKILFPLEIDLVHEPTKSCFEINGCLYHSENYGHKNKHYHLDKTLNCFQNGYNLYHIFEDEIKLKPNIVISKIENILHISNTTQIHARKCEISECLNTKDKSTFLNENHIQGNDKSIISIIAKYNNEIVAIMCFDNKRAMSKSNDHNESVYELTRFCVKLDKRVTGIANRLLKYFITNYKPSKIISFADIRWTPNSNENLYTKLGFKITKTLPPDYSYFKSSESRYGRLHKFGFGKTNLKRKFPEIYDDSKTEWKMMQELGYDRIWDCGKYKYELELT